MVSFVTPASGGIQPINGRAGSIVEDIVKADRGKPGRDIIPNIINQIEAATQVSLPPNACDPQAALQRAQQQVQQQVQLIIEQHITQQVQQEVQNSAPIIEMQKQLESLKQPQGVEVSESVKQQVEIIEKDIQTQINSAIVGVIGRVSTQLPQAAKVANTSAAGIKTVASVAESLAAFVPSQGINMSAYGSVTQKTVQTVSQACFI